MLTNILTNEQTQVNSRLLFIHRRSTAERGGCSQRRLFVWQCVCPYDNFRTTKRLKVGG